MIFIWLILPLISADILSHSFLFQNKNQLNQLQDDYYNLNRNRNKQMKVAVLNEELELEEGTSVIITSPKYPKKYPNNLNYRWILKSNSTLNYTCSGRIRGSRRCFYDYLQICAAQNGECSQRLCKKFDGISRSTETNYLEIKFKTNRRRNSKGFFCKISSSVSSNQNTEQDVSTMLPSTTIHTTTTTTASTTTTTTTSPTTTTALSTTTMAPELRCHCGKINRNIRIVGGSEIEIHEYPWLVGIRFSSSGSFSCGGTIVSKNWIITAAHCTYNRSPSRIWVVSGEHSVSTNSETDFTSVHNVQQIFNHEKYGSSSNDNDISALLLKQPLLFGLDNKVAPVCLPPPKGDYVGMFGTIAGWGSTSYKGPSSKVVLDVSLPIVSNGYCRSVYGNYITDNMICAGTTEGGKDSCQGDSGGPFITSGGSNNQSKILIGVVSFGFKCAEPGIPGVYAKVSVYLDWIKSLIGTDETCFMK